MDCVITNAVILDRWGVVKADVGLKNGRIAAIGLRGVFRVGYGPLDKLRRAALALHREGHVSLKAIGSLLDRPWGHALEALARWYPELPVESTSAGTRSIGFSLRTTASALVQLSASRSKGRPFSASRTRTRRT